MTLTLQRRTAGLIDVLCHAAAATLAVFLCLHYYRHVRPEMMPLAVLAATFIGVSLVRDRVLPIQRHLLLDAWFRPMLPLTLGVLAATVADLSMPIGVLRSPVNVLVALGAGTAGIALAQVALGLGLGLLLQPAQRQATVLVAGNNARTQEALRRWGRQSTGPVEIAGFVDATEGADLANPNPDQARWRKLGGIEHLGEILLQQVVDEVWVTLPARSHYGQIQDVLQMCETVGVPVRLPADLFRRGPSHVRRAEGDPVEDFYYQTTTGTPWQLMVKRLVDITASLLLMILLAPLLLVVAVAIKLTSRGPVFYRQIRCGLHGRAFELFKFRSMVAGAERLQESLSSRNEVDGPVFKMRHDPRVTRLGRFLRRTSIDELPQLWNVLKGEMSLVGPRPPVPREVAKYQPWQRRRLSVVPGLTCTWQVSGRSRLSFEDWMRLDIEYASNWSLRRDFLLLLKTIPAVLSMRGAA